MLFTIELNWGAAGLGHACLRSRGDLSRDRVSCGNRSIQKVSRGDNARDHQDARRLLHRSGRAMKPGIYTQAFIHKFQLSLFSLQGPRIACHFLS